MKFLKLNKNIFCILVFLLLLFIICFVLCTKPKEGFIVKPPPADGPCPTVNEVLRTPYSERWKKWDSSTDNIYKCNMTGQRVAKELRKGGPEFSNPAPGGDCSIAGTTCVPLIVLPKPGNTFIPKSPLINYAKPDPNIQPTAPQDYCLGDLKNINDNKPMGYFQSNPNATYLVKPMEKTTLVANSIEDCEAKCSFDDGCIGMKFDMDTFDKDKDNGIDPDDLASLSPNCTRYMMASPGDPDTVTGSSICTHIVGGGGEIANAGKDGRTTGGDNTGTNACSAGYTVYPDQNQKMEEFGVFSHSNKDACAVECINRYPDCEAYYYNEGNRWGLNCRIFKPNPNAPFAFPKSMLCSKNFTMLEQMVNKEVYLFNVKYNKPLGAVYYWTGNWNDGRIVLWGGPNEVKWKLTKVGNEYMLTSVRYAGHQLGSIFCWTARDKDYYNRCKPVLCDPGKLCDTAETLWKITNVGDEFTSNVFRITEITGNNNLGVTGGLQTNCRGGNEDMGGCKVTMWGDDSIGETQWRISTDEGIGKDFEP